MSLQDIISKVQKLRNLSHSSNLNEAANAAAVAEKLIAEYRLTEAELSVEKNISEPIIEAQEYLYETGKIVQWKSLLALYLSNHYGVFVYNSCDYSEGRKRTRYAMVGRDSDTKILKYNFDFLVNEISELCDLLCSGNGRRGVSIERNSFCLGAVDGIMAKLRAEKKEVESKATSGALVVLNNKLTEAAMFAKNTHNLGKATGHSQTRMDMSSYARGKEVGGKITFLK